jgi:hypothetical protein
VNFPAAVGGPEELEFETTAKAVGFRPQPGFTRPVRREDLKVLNDQVR